MPNNLKKPGGTATSAKFGKVNQRENQVIVGLFLQ